MNIKYIVLTLLLLPLTTQVVEATTDNNPTNFKIRDVFAAHRLLVTDGTNDTYLETSSGCTFSSKDLHDTIIVPKPSGNYLGSEYETYPDVNDTITYHGQTCSVGYSNNSPNFMRFKVKTKSDTTVTGVLDNGDKFTLTYSNYCEHYSFELDDDVYIWSYDYYPGNTDTIYVFEPSRFTPSTGFHTCGIVQTQFDKNVPELFPRRIAFSEERLAKRKRPESNRNNYLGFVNRTRDIISTSGWYVVNSDGISAQIPAASLKTNEELRIYSGTGTNVTDSVGEKKVYLGRKHKALFNEHVEWIQIQDATHTPLATFYTRYSR